jgi:hypothetical protein
LSASTDLNDDVAVAEPARRHPAARVAIAAGVFLVTVGLVWSVAAWTRSGPPSPSPADSWHAWARSFGPVYANFSSDYLRASRDLDRPDHGAARAEFEQLVGDAVRMSSLADSIDPTVNADVRRVATHVAATAQSVLEHWPTVDIARFNAEVGAYTSSSRDLTTAILVADQRYVSR